MWPPEAIWNDQTSLVTYYNSYAIPISPQPGVLIASIIVSILGSYATLLLLGRRTSNQGLRNWTLLGLAALCFAAVAVWGMHFVSMISVRLRASPDVTWFLEFSKGMTTLSLFVPLIATVFAFAFLGSELDLKYWRVIVAGVILGLTIGLMHYSASFYLPELDVSYSAVTVVFALILACVAATVALFLFFRFKSQWQESFWKRGACAIFLAGAVCGMHYLGLGGTSYRAKIGADPRELEGGSDQSTRLTIAISVMCGVIIAISIGFAVVDLLIRRDIRQKARNIVIASAAFDSTGKLLVKNDGTIPMQVIQTDAELARVLGELDPRQPTFQWLYQLSFNWSIAVPFIPKILGSFAERQKKPAVKDRSVNRSAWEQLLFRTRFVEASVLLAQQLDLPLESLGVMFDRVLTTGTREVEEEVLKGDEESSIHGIPLKLNTSEGVMLFVVREISGIERDSVESYAARGYRMAETRFFSKTLADHMGVSKPEMSVFLSACKTYAKRGTRPVVQPGGAYVGLYGVRPAGETELDVLVYNFARHQIPAYRLPEISYPLSPRVRTWIQNCSNLTMAEVVEKCNEEDTDDDLVYFQAAMEVSIEAMMNALRCWPSLMQGARLSPEVLELPTSEWDDKTPAQVVIFEVILPSPEARLTPVQSRASGVQAPGLVTARHESDKPPAPFVYTPYSLFSKSQAMILRSKGYEEFGSMAEGELGKVYPVVPADVAGELAVDPANPFGDKLGRGQGMDEKVMRKRPTTGDSEKGRGLPEHEDVRAKTDGWYTRSMRLLEGQDSDGVLDRVEY